MYKRIVRTIVSISAAIFAIGQLSGVAHAQGEPPTAPILRVETGMHIAGCEISVDAAGHYLVSGSIDKTVRVWDLTTERLVETLRPPIGDGWAGEIYTVAISPDGETIACAGHTSFEWDGSDCIYLFDRATGAISRRIIGTRGSVNYPVFNPVGLVFSRDGRYLAEVCWKGGLKVYNSSDGSLVGQDINYSDESYGVAFGPSGSGTSIPLATTCLDGFIRLYTVSFSGIAFTRKMKVAGSSLPWGIAFSPDGTKIAVGYNNLLPNALRVDVISASDLSLLYTPKLDDLTGSATPSVCWSQDGAYLYASGDISASGKQVIRRWAYAGHGPSVDLAAGSGDIKELPDGGIVFAGSRVGIIEADGRKSWDVGPPIADFRNNQDGFKLNPNGLSVAFSYANFGKSPAIYSVGDRGISEGDAPLSFSAPVTQVTGVNIQDWHGTYHPTLNGTAIKLREYEYSRSIAIAPDHRNFLLGTTFELYCFNTDGTKKWSVPGIDIALYVNVSSDGKLAVAAGGDGTIRWYRMSDGKELLDFFPAIDRKRWVAWTPSGYYDCSPGGEDLIGWQVNRGKDQAADFFPASRFHDTYYRPDVIANVLSIEDENTALQIANSSSGRISTPIATTADFTAKEPPVVTILSPQSGDSESSDQLTIHYMIRTPSGEPVTAVHVLVNGRPVDTGAKSIQIVSSDDQAKTMTVTIPHADCSVSVIANNRFTSSEASTVNLIWKGAAPSLDMARKPNLYILAVGIGAYPNPIPQLTYPPKDARDFVTSMTQQKGLLYGMVTSKLITESSATRDSIIKGLDWIEHQTTQYDVAMIFFSGHGVDDEKGDFYFAPVDIDLNDLRGTGVRTSDIEDTIQNLPCKTLFFIDSCHAGNALGTAKLKGIDVNGFVNELSSAETGAIVFASSTGRQESEEDDSWGNGAFTKALVEGLDGKATAENGRITWESLSIYVSDRVKELTHGDQTPTTTTPNTVPDFPIAVAQ